MNLIIQNVLVVLVVLYAIWYLVTKFIWKPSLSSSTSKKSLTTCAEHKCGCH
ncbi:hypothetical protein ACE939_12290 [Aquimarina sp. W85]|uniref:hypothetical protein n=1 Tax=Aquimarina rhodophyticola TaxID=3342246 RepID=UPI003670020D